MYNYKATGLKLHCHNNNNNYYYETAIVQDQLLNLLTAMMVLTVMIAFKFFVAGVPYTLSKLAINFATVSFTATSTSPWTDLSSQIFLTTCF